MTPEQIRTAVRDIGLVVTFIEQLKTPPTPVQQNIRDATQRLAWFADELIDETVK